MFGFSLAELLVVGIVILIFVKPKDLPEIAYFLGRVFYRCKRYLSDFKDKFTEIEKDLGFDEIKKELNRAKISEELSNNKIDFDEDESIIVDIEGNEHRVKNINQIRSDLSKEKIQEEIATLNKINSQKNSILEAEDR
jgi:sec-independent protein translocase protein TatB